MAMLRIIELAERVSEIVATVLLGVTAGVVFAIIYVAAEVGLVRF